MVGYKRFFRQNIAAKFILFSLIAISLRAQAASIAPRIFNEMVVNSTEGFYDETNNIPRSTAPPTFEMPPLVVCSNNCTLNSPFTGYLDSTKHQDRD
ncbi:uncharacterized protein ATC70_009951 [Mucor velutinosus]|uniref:Uncharacterized protein n=1 Tax=Mucor velutinosus TaxID=708070 RepID=A0AAN7I3E4_9FUNG|nr:hypothetical protein ATC70_009951 [Mucor velutinosus]